jgi:hypothetical protein
MFESSFIHNAPSCLKADIQENPDKNVLVAKLLIDYFNEKSKNVSIILDALKVKDDLDLYEINAYFFEKVKKNLESLKIVTYNKQLYIEAIF